MSAGAPFDLARLTAALGAPGHGDETTHGGCPVCPRRLGRVVVALGEAGSTQDEARALAGAGAPDGTLVLAVSQTSGRGRRGRVWRSPSGGGVWATAILRFARPLASPALLTLAGSVALCEAARERGVASAEIKWPNDLIVRDRKFAGILGEMLAAEGGAVALLGFGVNVDLDPALLGDGIAADATSLREAGLARVIGREEMLATILGRLDDSLAEAALGPGGHLLARWTALSPSSNGRRVDVIEPSSVEGGAAHRSVRGTTRGIGPDGALRLESEGGERIEVRHGGTLRFVAEGTLEDSLGPSLAGGGRGPRRS